MTTSCRTAVLVAAFALLTASHPYAAATYRSKGFRCVQSPTTGGTVTVNWPSLTSVSGNPENVYFLAVLYRWQNGGWQPYKQLPINSQTAYPLTWYRGLVNGAGPMNLGTITYPYYWSVGGTQVAEPVFGVPAGSYAVGEFYRWTNGISASTWGLYQGTYTYCTIR